MQAVIMAGGKGTRLKSLTKNLIPKPLMHVLGKSLLERQIESLKKNGITDIIITLGHLGELIRAQFADGGELGVRLRYFTEDEPLGSSGSLAHIRHMLTEHYFLLVFGDTVFDIDIQRMEDFHLQKKASATLFVHPNSHPFDSDLILTNEESRITGFDSKHNTRNYFYHNCVNAGFYILETKICTPLAYCTKIDLEKDILVPMIHENQHVFAYHSPEYIKDAGTPERIRHVENDLEKGIVEQRCLKNKQKAIFLDRDGTLNVYKGLLYTSNELELIENTDKALELINASGFLAIVITNQPAVARGLCTIADINAIHEKMETLLGKTGVYLDDVLFCPHHPDKGYPEENPAYKIDCKCRKPKTGMIDYFIEKYNIERTQSWMIGDTTTDIQTGKNADLHTLLVQTGCAGNDNKYPVIADEYAKDLLAGIRKILKV